MAHLGMQASRQISGESACPPFLPPTRLATILKHMLNHYAPLDQMFQALSDPSRRAMVERLSRGPASVSELAKPLAMSLPAVVQHLQVLEDSGIVRSTKIGRVRMCRLEPEALRTAEQWISERREVWEHRLDRLGEYLAEHPDEPNEGSTS
ncbi:MAG: transcriptional regulator [Chloroflexi bacterium]|nr:transcriptional regulator [Chloroflexota bacterium]